MDEKILALMQKAHKHTTASFTARSWDEVINHLPDWRWLNTGSRTEPRYDVMSPSGEQLVITKKANYKKVVFYDLVDWLPKTSFYDDLAKLLGAEVYDPSAVYVRTEENTGTCPICLRNIKLALNHDPPRMVQHGYRRPGDGGIYGSCFGVGRPPYELSSIGCRGYLIQIVKPQRAKHDLRLHNLATGQVAEIIVKRLAPRTFGERFSERREVDFVIRRGDVRKFSPELPSWEDALANAIREEKQKVSLWTTEERFFQMRVDQWIPEPLPAAGLRVKDGR